MFEETKKHINVYFLGIHWTAGRPKNGIKWRYRYYALELANRNF